MKIRAKEHKENETRLPLIPFLVSPRTRRNCTEPKESSKEVDDRMIDLIEISLGRIWKGERGRKRGKKTHPD